MTRLILDDPEFEQAVADLYEVIRPNCVVTVGPYLVCVAPHVGAEVDR